MYTDLTDDEIDALNEIFKHGLDPNFKTSHYDKYSKKFFNMCKNLHNKGYIRITPLHFLEMTVEECANSNEVFDFEVVDKGKPLFDEYKKNHTL